MITILIYKTSFTVPNIEKGVWALGSNDIKAQESVLFTINCYATYNSRTSDSKNTVFTLNRLNCYFIIGLQFLISSIVQITKYVREFVPVLGTVYLV